MIDDKREEARGDQVSFVATTSLMEYDALLKWRPLMATGLSEFPGAVTPTPDDSRLAQESSRRLIELLAREHQNLKLHIQAEDEPEEAISIPFSAYRLLADLLTEMAKGNAAALIPIHADLSTQQAADLINVSRPFLIERLERGEIPFRKVGEHRRVLFQDVMAYKQTMDRNRLRALDELVAQAQELGMGY
jgi:excisionase family DNA binding protein